MPKRAAHKEHLGGYMDKAIKEKVQSLATEKRWSDTQTVEWILEQWFARKDPTAPLTTKAKR